MQINTLTIPAADYHAAPRCGECISSHPRGNFREAPELYRRKISGEIEETESCSVPVFREVKRTKVFYG